MGNVLGISLDDLIGERLELFLLSSDRGFETVRLHRLTVDVDENRQRLAYIDIAVCLLTPQ